MKRPSVRRQLEDLRTWLLSASLSIARAADKLDRTMYEMDHPPKPKRRRRKKR